MPLHAQGRFELVVSRFRDGVAGPSLVMLVTRTDKMRQGHARQGTGQVIAFGTHNSLQKKQGEHRIDAPLLVFLLKLLTATD